MAETIDQLRGSFVEETRDLINELEDILLSTEVDSVDSDTIDQIFRSVHTIKGSGGMLGFDKVLEVTHDLEDIYDKVRTGSIDFTSGLKDISLETIDVLKTLLATNENLDDEEKVRFANLCRKIELYDVNASPQDQSSSSEPQKSKKEPRAVSSYFIKVVPENAIPADLEHPKFLIEELTLMGESLAFSSYSDKVSVNNFSKVNKKSEWIVFLSTVQPLESIENVFEWANESFSLTIEELSDGDLFMADGFREELEKRKDELFKISETEIFDFVKEYSDKIQKHVAEEKQTSQVQTQKSDSDSNKNGKIISSIRVSTDKIDMLMNLVSEMVTLQARLNLLSDEIGDERLNNVAEKYGSFSRQLRDNAFTISLVPFGVTITRYKRLVHDLSLQLDKKVEFITEGEDTVLDKKIIEQLSDPIMHILRNCVDHGIEDTEERIASGKPEAGNIQMKIYHQSNNVIIKIIDDGKGIDYEVIRRIAIERGLLTPDQNISDKDILNLIFLPGFSSAKKISNVSGRGVGLDVVKRNIADIRGTIEINTEKNKGTTFVVKLPLTLSIIDGLQVHIDDRNFIIPLVQVDKILAFDKLKSESKLSQVIDIDGVQVPYFDLRADFNIGGKVPERREMVIVSFENEKVVLIVDSVVGENQTVLKPLGKHYKNQNFISGGTILGDGTVALVLDVNKIVTEFSKK
ncbi:MAG: chemotaxis protein CheA [Prolixibacteraceae bacterium]|jgi:two-component system chemotaxis sensor kinase CheA|nr:chemotaxis protein CheA [Prolixibacteraceae bacterium]